jgi:acyl carrier protein
MDGKFTKNLQEVFENQNLEIKEDDTFRDYDEWDSLTHLSLIAMLDDEYGVQIEADEFKHIKTIGELFTLVSSSSN